MNADDFFDGYIEAMLWANTIDPSTGETPDTDPGPGDVADGALKAMTADCRDFLAYPLSETLTVGALIDSLPYYAGRADYAGHDFALTRNGHGVGFWDRGLGEAGQLLTDAAQTFGDQTLIADGGPLHIL